MTEALIVMGGLGLGIGLVLAVAAKLFYVYIDPKIEAVSAALPGANCGGCGLPGCSANAEAIVAGRSSPNSCVAAGPEVGEAIAALLGVSVAAVEPNIARPGCYFGVAKADTKFLYHGLDDCRAAAMLSGGMKVCTIGCLGLGTCVRACPFNAIEMGAEGLPVVDPKKCTGCGTCERICPKHIINLSSVTRRIMREYTTQECTTPCQRACPAGIDIREYIRQISLGDSHRAVQVIKERNPFPAVIGRICPRPCETECRRQLVDEPVAINYLKRFAADFEKQSGKRVLPYAAPATGRRIAVVGGGVEGLSTAFFAARLGHSPTVFEAASKLGGVLRSAIARERLPEEILDWDIQGIMDMGVRAETGKVLGKDFTIDSLLQDGYQAVFLATGGWDSRLARAGAAVLESPLPGTFLLVDLLRAEAGAPILPMSPEAEVVIYGGGKLALDAARRCRDFGARNITILFRERWDRSPLNDADVAASGLDGLAIRHAAAIQKLFGEGGDLTGVEVLDLESGQIDRLAAQRLILPAGRFPELIFIPAGEASSAETGSAPATHAWEGILPYKHPWYRDQPGIYAAGDVLTDYSAAIKAIGAGRRAAASLHLVMNGIALQLEEKVIGPQSYLQNVFSVENIKPFQRQIMPICSGPELKRCGEIERGFSEDTARKEAGRCLQCGLICYRMAPPKKPVTASSVPA
jgi:NADPH-dependent glutamate synthase beta subunit-like oxidoreductase/Na+-translocating ferredoxin:NAD+ oxidoreductase RNF subunit RnfB